MKVIVQIPSFNEELTLPQTVAEIPRVIDGVDEVRILVIDDGSTDNTVQVARDIGVDYVVRHKNNKGLARSFRTGVDAALKLGADIIVNTDGDNQYPGRFIPALIRPVLDGEYDIVVGDRQTDRVAHFSWGKRRLQKLGSFVVRNLSETNVPDAVSGFRAMSRDAALQMNIVSEFSYTIEMLIQAGKKHLAVGSVPIVTNPKTRDSRLFKSIPNFLKRSLSTIIRMYTMFQPLRVYFYSGGVLILIGAIPIIRFLYFYSVGEGDGHIQSLIVGGVLLQIGFIALMMGLIGDLINFNRQLIEMTLERVRRIELTTIQTAMAERTDSGAQISAAGGKQL